MKEINLNLVGCGGVGVKVARELSSSAPVGLKQITLWDGDAIENRNLERQIFQKNQVGMTKSSATRQLFFEDANIRGDLNVSSLWDENYLDKDKPWDEGTVFIVTTDNIESRLLLLEVIDEFGSEDSLIISGANATADDGFGIGSTAWVYKKEWKGSQKDPRIRDQLESQENIDLGRPCTEVSEPQTALANSGASIRVVEMLAFYCSELTEQYEEHLASQHSLFWKQVAI